MPWFAVFILSPICINRLIIPESTLSSGTRFISRGFWNSNLVLNRICRKYQASSDVLFCYSRESITQIIHGYYQLPISQALNALVSWYLLLPACQITFQDTDSICNVLSIMFFYFKFSIIPNSITIPFWKLEFVFSEKQTDRKKLQIRILKEYFTRKKFSLGRARKKEKRNLPKDKAKGKMV